MKMISENIARQDLSNLVEDVYQNHEPVIIRLENGHSAVVISLADYKEMDETEYLLSSPENAKRLLQSIEDCRNGINLVERELIDP